MLPEEKSVKLMKEERNGKKLKGTGGGREKEHDWKDE